MINEIDFIKKFYLIYDNKILFRILKNQLSTNPSNFSLHVAYVFPYIKSSFNETYKYLMFYVSLKNVIPKKRDLNILIHIKDVDYNVTNLIALFKLQISKISCESFIYKFIFQQIKLFFKLNEILLPQKCDIVLFYNYIITMIGDKKFLSYLTNLHVPLISIYNLNLIAMIKFKVLNKTWQLQLEINEIELIKSYHFIFNNLNKYNFINLITWFKLQLSKISILELKNDLILKHIKLFVKLNESMKATNFNIKLLYTYITNIISKEKLLAFLQELNIDYNSIDNLTLITFVIFNIENKKFIPEILHNKNFIQNNHLFYDNNTLFKILKSQLNSESFKIHTQYILPFRNITFQEINNYLTYYLNLPNIEINTELLDIMYHINSTEYNFLDLIKLFELQISKTISISIKRDMLFYQIKLLFHLNQTILPQNFNEELFYTYITPMILKETFFNYLSKLNLCLLSKYNIDLICLFIKNKNYIQNTIITEIKKSYIAYNNFYSIPTSKYTFEFSNLKNNIFLLFEFYKIPLSIQDKFSYKDITLYNDKKLFLKKSNISHILKDINYTIKLCFILAPNVLTQQYEKLNMRINQSKYNIYTAAKFNINNSVKLNMNLISILKLNLRENIKIYKNFIDQLFNLFYMHSMLHVENIKNKNSPYKMSHELFKVYLNFYFQEEYKLTKNQVLYSVYVIYEKYHTKFIKHIQSTLKININLKRKDILVPLYTFICLNRDENTELCNSDLLFHNKKCKYKNSLLKYYDILMNLECIIDVPFYNSCNNEKNIKELVN